MEQLTTHENKKRRVYSAERNKKISIAMTKHGQIHAPVYRSWMSMKRRCLIATDKNYPNWGGRGIKICDRWMTFVNFYSDMGDRPEDSTLDRINNDGNYEPGNCRWATKKQQRANRRDSK